MMRDTIVPEATLRAVEGNRAKATPQVRPTALQRWRVHLALDEDTLIAGQAQSPVIGRVIEPLETDGLHHRYVEQVATQRRTKKPTSEGAS